MVNGVSLSPAPCTHGYDRWKTGFLMAGVGTAVVVEVIALRG
jgi:hypothetical protein